MSEKKIHGAEFKYVDFLWKEIAKIRDCQTSGDLPQALRLATSLISYLPVAIKNKFRKPAKEIEKDIRNILTKVEGVDFHTTQMARNKALRQYAAEVLDSFMDEISTVLDKRGYMEKTRDVPVGGE